MPNQEKNVLNRIYESLTTGTARWLQTELMLSCNWDRHQWHSRLQGKTDLTYSELALIKFLCERPGHEGLEFALALVTKEMRKRVIDPK